MTPLARTRAALRALPDAGPAERPAAFSALTEACNGLAALVKQYEDWLNRECGALWDIETDGMAVMDSATVARQATWIKNLRIYERAFAVLADAVMATKGE